MKNVLCILLISSGLSASIAGPLTPPGAPAPTMKTLNEVEARTPIRAVDLPLTISQPGSYYLAESIHYTTIPADNSPTAAITIASDDVSLDLNGFTLRGPGAASFGSCYAIRSTSSDRIQVRNGTVTEWSGMGVFISGGSGGYAENVTCADNGSHGLVANGMNVSNCRTTGNDGIGIASQYSNITNCFSEGNTSHGFQIERDCYVQNNSAINNDGDGIKVLGIVSFRGSRIEGNTVNDNTIGISLGANNVGIKNTGRGNSSSDFSFEAGSIYGPIVDMSGGGEISSTHPWANISY